MKVDITIKGGYLTSGFSTFLVSRMTGAGQGVGNYTGGRGYYYGAFDGIGEGICESGHQRGDGLEEYEIEDGAIIQ